MKRDSIHTLVLCALLSAFALALSYIETLFPLPLPVPGARLGLGNALVLLALLTLSACGAQTLPADEGDVPPVEGISQTQEDGQTGTKVVYIPMWMQDYSVVYYDAHLNRTVESGGDLTEEEINSREDIFPEEMYTIAAEPNTKVE